MVFDPDDIGNSSHSEWPRENSSHAGYASETAKTGCLRRVSKRFS
jgi:hypothetical protein